MTRLFQCLFAAATMLYASMAMAALTPEVSAKAIRNFTRITFNWPEKIRLRVEPTRNGAVLSFSQPTSINLAKVKSDLGALLSGSNISADGTRVTLTFNKPYRVRHFISGNANGIDILGAKPQPAPKAKTSPPPVAAKPQPLIATEQPQKPEAKAAAEPESKQIKAPKPQAAKPAAKAAPKAPAETPVSKAASEAPAAKAKASPSPTKAPLPQRSEEKASTAASPPPSASSNAPAPVTAPKPATAKAPSPPIKAASKSKDHMPDSAQDNPFLITTYSLATGTEIRFPWVQRTAASVFMRDNTLWTVFSNEQVVNMELLRSILPVSVVSVEEVNVPGHLVLRFETDGSVYPKIRQPKNTAQWWITLSRYPQIPADIIDIKHRAGQATADHLYIPELQYDTPVSFTDPVIGDELTAVPFFTSGRGVYPERNYPQVHLLQSAQGVGIVNKDDFTQVRQLRNGFRISARDGLSLSKDQPELKLAELDSVKSSITWYPYSVWKVEPGTFIDTRRLYENQLANASDVRAASLRLKLAQLYLGQGMGTEALAWLELIEEQNPSFFKERDLAALRAAAYFVNDDYEQAQKHFADESLRGESELKLWNQALRVFSEERPRFDYMDFYPTYISKYPPKMKEKLAILGADNYINRRSYSRALKTLNTISNDENLAAHTESYIYFLLGKVAAETGNTENAKNIWEPLTELDAPRFVRATTQFALTSMLYNNNEITVLEAIERLERVRIIWRGDALEMGILDYLAQLYTSAENPLMALRTWQELIRNFPDSPQAIGVASKMAEAFNHLYAQGGAEKLSPLEALSVFYEFKELTPIGQAGDTMIQSLAERLVSVDLLDRAAALIEHQIRFRQEKLARSQLATQLALIYLLNGEPERAVETLELTGYGEMPEDLATKRRRIAALAMSEAGEPRRALRMLFNDDSSEADRLRLHIFWQRNNWPNVIFNAERLLSARADVTAALTPLETEHLLQLAIAYMYEGNETQLQYLRNYFTPLLPEGPNKDIFAYVTDTGSPLDPTQFSEVASQINSLESFMQSYKKQVEEGGLSPIIN